MNAIKANIINVDYFGLDPIYFDFECEIQFTRLGICNSLQHNLIPILFDNSTAYKVFVSCNEPSSSPNREPPSRIIENSHQYDLILTTDESVLSTIPNSILFPYGTTWLCKSSDKHSDCLGVFDADVIQGVEHKQNNISFMSTNHFGSIGYTLRKQIWNNKHLLKYSTVFYSSTRFITNQPTWNGLLFSDTLRDGLLPNDDKLNLFKSKFTIVVENNKEKWYFTEKIVDAFLTKTVPIYWGCANIGDFFDVRGIIIFDSFEEFIEKSNSITDKTYNDMKPYIEHNYNIAKHYGGSIFERVREEILLYRDRYANS
jgi:hypothetical protein